jgi:ATP-dependent RNA circularization protein (DNA/RNA ligase family)
VVGSIKQLVAYLFYEKSELVFDTINDAKALVTYMKKTSLNKKLNNKMKQDGDTL